MGSEELSYRSFDAVGPHSDLDSVGSLDWVRWILRQVRRAMKKISPHWLVGEGTRRPQAIILKHPWAEDGCILVHIQKVKKQLRWFRVKPIDEAKMDTAQTLVTFKLPSLCRVPVLILNSPVQNSCVRMNPRSVLCSKHSRSIIVSVRMPETTHPASLSHKLINFVNSVSI